MMKIRLAHLVGPPKSWFGQIENFVASGEKTASFFSEAASSTGWEKLDRSAGAVKNSAKGSLDRICGCVREFGTDREVRRLSRGKIEFSFDCGVAKGDGPVAERTTSCHRPMSLSGGVGFQSTQVIPSSAA